MKINQHTQTLLVVEERKFSHMLPMLFIVVGNGIILYGFFSNTKEAINFNYVWKESIGLLFIVSVLLMGLFYFVEFTLGREEYRFDKISGRFHLKRRSLFTSKAVHGFLKNIQAIKIIEDNSDDTPTYNILLHTSPHKKPIYLPLGPTRYSHYTKEENMASTIAGFLQLPPPSTIK